MKKLVMIVAALAMFSAASGTVMAKEIRQQLIAPSWPKSTTSPQTRWKAT